MVNSIVVVDFEVLLSPTDQLRELAKIYETRSTFGFNTVKELINERKILKEWT